ncbi:TPA: transcriptional regulator [Staphylococcus aureus]|nr:transcriptional regulator [Staphylococcus aureus]
MILYKLDSIRTNNFNDPEIMNKIGDLWKNVFNNYDLEDASIYAVYDEYESDYKGDYTLSLYTTKEIDSESIELSLNNMTSYQCESREDIPKVWGKIWEDEEQNKIERKYDRDFEQYNSDNTINILISTK